MWHKLATDTHFLLICFRAAKKGVPDKTPLITANSLNYGDRNRKNCVGGLVTAKLLVNVPVALNVPVVLVVHMAIGVTKFVVDSQV